MEQLINLDYWIVTIISGVIVAAVVWLSTKFLKKSISAWFLPIAVLLGFILNSILLSEDIDDKLEVIIYENFDSETLEIDGKQFTSCSFNNTKFIYRGKQPFGFDRCSFSKNDYFEFKDNANVTVSMLQNMYRDQYGTRKHFVWLLKELVHPDSLKDISYSFSPPRR